MEAFVNRPLLELRQVSQVYGSRRVLDIPELGIREGELLAIVGPNGSGKSTLLRLIHLLEQASEGEILFDGHPVPYPPPLELRRQIAMVFQKPLMLNGSVAGNLRFPLRLRRLPSSERLRQLAELLDLGPLMQASARTLSGGEAQRLALGRALAIRPRLLLLDEPTANLDPYNVGKIEAIMTAVGNEGAMTQVLVTHNIFQARRLADRVVMLLGGKIIEDAARDEFFEAPRDPRTLAFINGEMVY
jgi:tungstate transport system ATP-binding protein